MLFDTTKSKLAKSTLEICLGEAHDKRTNMYASSLLRHDAPQDTRQGVSRKVMV